MERCIECNSLLSREEKMCTECGTKVLSDESSMANLVASLISILFYISLVILCVSPFIDRAPSVVFCLLITGALLFIMRTAKDSAQKVRRR
jgi:hypothetical protein